MKTIIRLLVTGLLFAPSYVIAQSQDEVEITQLILDGDIPYSQHGALEFWSSGGLVHEIPLTGRTVEFDQINIHVD